MPSTDLNQEVWQEGYMFIGKTLKSGVGIAVVVRRIAEERLQTKCFRGVTLPLAGNFLQWNSADELFRDDEVMGHFLTELDELWSEQDFGTHSVNIVYSMPVGWESTAPLQDFGYGDIEGFDLNRRSRGMRVRPSLTCFLAPKTNQVTIVFEFKREGDNAAAIVHSIYPGADIGELDGDVTMREDRVFFDWNHPGSI